MQSNNKGVALLVHSCDRYEFLYQGFSHFFSKHWKSNIPCQYYFATEEIQASIPGFTNIRSGKGEWADRLKILLNEKIKEDYVLYFQEDMWLNKDVDEEFFRQLFDSAIDNRWNQVKLHSSEVYQTTGTGNFIEGFNVAEINNKTSDFLMSHQVTLWKKDFLIAQLLKNEHPWRNEKRATKRLKKLNPVIHHIDYFAENGKPPINTNRSLENRSEYNTVSINGMLNDNVGPYITALMNGNASDQQYAAELQHHYDNHLTHDGKPKPRKEDIFKKIKNLVIKTFR